MKNNPQKIIDKLCEIHSVPKIPVIIRKLESEHAFFDGDEYVIVVDPNASIENVCHEFTHYLIRLMVVASEIEESVCDYGSLGILAQGYNLAGEEDINDRTETRRETQGETSPQTR